MTTDKQEVERPSLETLIDLIGELGREVTNLLDDCETSGGIGAEVHSITSEGLNAVSAILDRIDALPFEEMGYILGTGAMLQAALKQTFNTNQEVLRVKLEAAEAESEDIYKIGVRDGYEKGVQDADQRTGGNGEFTCCLGFDPDDRHCPSPQAMLVRMADRWCDLEAELTEANARAGAAAEADRDRVLSHRAEISAALEEAIQGREQALSDALQKRLETANEDAAKVVEAYAKGIVDDWAVCCLMWAAEEVRNINRAGGGDAP